MGESADEFQRSVERLTQGLEENPDRVPDHALYACQDRLRWAVRLEQTGHEARAARSLDFCLRLPGPSPEQPAVARKQATREEQLAAAQARTAESARREFDQALELELEPDLANGLRIYRECARCHTPEGWGFRAVSSPGWPDSTSGW